MFSTTLPNKSKTITCPLLLLAKLIVTKSLVGLGYRLTNELVCSIIDVPELTNSLTEFVVSLHVDDSVIIHLKLVLLFAMFTFDTVSKLVSAPLNWPNYGGSIIRDIKAVSKYAKKKNLVVNSYIEFIQKYKQQKTDKIIHTFSIDELNTLEKWETRIERLNNARNWLIFGCNTGQRVEDLLNITLKNFVTINDKKYIELTQEKTSKDVLIPITKQCERILKKDFPYRISQQKLNEYIKEVCEKAKIIQVVEGDLYDKETKRKVRGFYPKSKLMTSHSFRRSYATNNYIDVPTPVIMEITGHSKESTFLEYINKPVDKTRNANLMLELMELAESKRLSKKETKTTQMKKVNQ